MWGLSDGETCILPKYEQCAFLVVHGVDVTATRWLIALSIGPSSLVPRLKRLRYQNYHIMDAETCFAARKISIIADKWMI